MPHAIRNCRGIERTGPRGTLTPRSVSGDGTQVECGVLSTALNALAADLQAAKSKLGAAVADAEGEKLTVEKNGSVTSPEG